jgi:hypothetical protein
MDEMDPRYSLIVKAPDRFVALAALDDLRVAVARFDTTTVNSTEQWLDVEFAFGDGSEFGHDLDIFTRIIETRLNEWFVRDRNDCQPGRGYPIGSLLYWTRRDDETS